jgi:carbon storage regulator CsrA
MLVLSRKVFEEIVISGVDGRPLVTVTVARIAANKVRIGITAPPELNIRRAELPAREPEGTRDQRTGARSVPATR